MKFRLVEDYNLLEWGPRGQGIVCRTLIQVLKLVGIKIPSGKWVLHHKDGNHSNEALENLLIMSVSDHSSYHNTSDKHSWSPKDPTYDVKNLIDKFIQENGSGESSSEESRSTELAGTSR